MSHSGPHPGWATQRQKRSQVMGPRRVLSFRPGGVGPQSREGVGVPRALTGRGATWLGWAPSPSCGKLLVACAASPWLPGSSSQPPLPCPQGYGGAVGRAPGLRLPGAPPTPRCSLLLWLLCRALGDGQDRLLFQPASPMGRPHSSRPAVCPELVPAGPCQALSYKPEPSWLSFLILHTSVPALTEKLRSGCRLPGMCMCERGLRSRPCPLLGPSSSSLPGPLAQPVAAKSPLSLRRGTHVCGRGPAVSL